MEISPDGRTIFIAEDFTSNVIIFNTETEQVDTVLDLHSSRTVDGAAGIHSYYVATYGGDVFKIGMQSQAIEDTLQLQKTLNALDVTAADELLYVLATSDSTLNIVETSTMTKISEVKVPGSLKRVAISVKNYP